MLSSQALLHLSLIETIGVATVQKLLESFSTGPLRPKRDSGQLDDILYRMSVSDLIYYGQLSYSKAELILKGLSNKQVLENELSLIARYDINVTNLFESTYPARLKEIACPPLILYTKGPGGPSGRRGVDNKSASSDSGGPGGRQSADNKSAGSDSGSPDGRRGVVSEFSNSILDSDAMLAVVGSRKGDAYGKNAVDALIPPLVAQGWTIVSGGALGIDSMAHRATIAAGGCTIAVLGSGLLKPYPASHKELFKRILDTGGSLVSPFPLMMEAQPGFFPARNRIIAGLSRGCLVIQAGVPSGALITAQFALNQGREVFAVPGAIDNPLSIGCHQLISQGAMLVSQPQDILTAFGYEVVHKANKQIADKPLDLKPAIPADHILSLCANPTTLDDIIQQVGLPASEVQELLWQLILDAKVAQSTLGLWQRI